LPYEPNSPPPDLLAERLSILHDLANGRALTIIATCDAVLGRLPPIDFIRTHALALRVGDTIDRTAMLKDMSDHGYLRVERVSAPGEFAIRGSVIDVFATGADAPVRLDLFDDEIEKLRTFAVGDQRSTGSMEKIEILPAREFPFDADAITGFRQRFRTAFQVEPGRSPIYRDISEAVLPAGIEYYLPLFFDTTVSLFDYLGPNACIFDINSASDALADSWELIESRYEQLCGDVERPLLEPDKRWIEPADVISGIEKLSVVRVTTRTLEDPDGKAGANAPVSAPLRQESADDASDPLRWLNPDAADRTLIVTSSAGRREMIADLLRGRGMSARQVDSWEDFVADDAAMAIGVGEISGSFVIADRGLQIHSAEQIGMEKPRQRTHTRRRRRARDTDAIVRELTDLQVGAPVVHEDYGVGRYRGLVTLDVDTRPVEFLLIEYADSDKLYVPVHSLHLVSRYTGAAPENAPLHRLGSDQWANARRKAAEQAHDVAAELLNLYAQRAARQGSSMETESDGYQRFALEFPYEETEDQDKAIREVFGDMATERPMDRIICGDVGFGKTEVALRSAFVTVHAGQQVAILVPTTLLAQQHFRTFSDRFANWPVTVKLLSRFNTGKAMREALEGIANGTVDIVIGTHKLLQRDVSFKKLGLVIIDEEHRFGVKDKEKLKKLRANVDILTMTATPIPRTLNMSLGGLRDLSIIATPPTDRLAVKTFVGEWSDSQIRDAVLREIRRGGQVFFLHNRVEDIEKWAEKLASIVPAAQIRVAHGQMRENELEAVMIDFYHRRFNVLVCTTIIESGIDIPTANTIIINRADKLGLAQLHQLRGRVGRSHHQAYAYLIAPPVRALTDDARKRLEAVEALDTLGSGFTLATHDLEIRGAGELLGEGQSGQISAVGFSLYNELLARAVAALREGKEPDLEDPFDHGPEIDLGLIALIPEDYMPDVHMRLVQYKRIANAETNEKLAELQVELIDRFGLLPTQTKTLFEITTLKLIAQQLGISRIRASASGGTIEFGKNASIDPAVLLSLVAESNGAYRLDGPWKLRFEWDEPATDTRIAATKNLLNELGADAQTPVYS
jgi:transcription-repair coupling factor (superfamily II helicase)